MKNTAAQRLAIAIGALQKRVFDYCKICNDSDLKMGACLVSPKRAFLKPPTAEIQKQLEHIGAGYFTPLGANGFYF